MLCPSCGESVEPGRKFCSACGNQMSPSCPRCGFQNDPGARFCGECGTSLARDVSALPGAGAFSSRPNVAMIQPAPTTERRRVTVLFADLVGFTGLAEDRDPEAVRELLSRYFDTCREVIHRYGGTVEKFIGDAVMAVWGAPIAREDDAERAVRAAIDLVEVVRTLGPSPDGEPLTARAGVMSGEAAVALGAVDQGLVAGDLVNTASRLQSVAPPGSVLVGESTYEQTSRAIDYEPAGERELKGKAAPVAAWHALRIAAKRGGVGRAQGLEPPFVGRDDQLRVLKDALHATGRDKRLRFISVTGQAGTGKTRLTWEFLKYVDGLVEPVFWHQGRSPAYGEGITFWALGEMVRKRAGLAEGDDEATTREAIGTTLEEYAASPEERAWIEPKLLALLGIGEVRAQEREELFGAWRTFFERVSAKGTAVLVFEDIHWADQGLLDFIDHLAEWSGAYPVLLITLARAEFLDAHPSWGAGRRNFIALALDPLPDAAMDDLLSGIVPGLPQRAREAILKRAEGVPLYAVETVRKLLLDGRIEQTGGAFRPVGDLTDLQVPDTLHALIAARLDGLDPEARALLQDASVLGQTFSVAALAGVNGSTEAELEPRLRDLIRSEVLTVNRDPLAPERGQYGFVQALIREVAYGTLARRERRGRHLAAARYFESLGDEEIVGALATHYLDAYRASDEGPEADAIAVQARIALRAAAERAAALHSPTQALSYLLPALDVTKDPRERGALLELSGAAAQASIQYDLAERHLREAVVAYRDVGDDSGVARTTAALGRMITFQGRPQAGISIIEPVLDEMAHIKDDPAVLGLQAVLARAFIFTDEYSRALAVIDDVLSAAEKIDDMALLTDAVITKGTALLWAGRYREALVMLTGGLQMAESHGVVTSELRARLNISFLQTKDDPRLARDTARLGLSRARRLGFGDWALLLAGNTATGMFPLGEWDDILRIAGDLVSDPDSPPTDALELWSVVAVVRAVRGDAASGSSALAGMDATVAGVTTVQEHSTTALARSWIDLAAGRIETALGAPIYGTEAGMASVTLLGLKAHVAAWTGDIVAAREAERGMDALASRGRWVSASRLVVAAIVHGLEGRHDEAIAAQRAALETFRAQGIVTDTFLTLMDQVALSPNDEFAGAAATEARSILQDLQATALTARLDELEGQRARRPRAAPSDGLDAVRPGSEVTIR